MHQHHSLFKVSLNKLQDLAHNLRNQLKDKTRFLAPNRPQHSFGVDHYAGRVTYVTNLMMEKNKDFVVREHQQLMANSQHALVRSASPLVISYQ